MPLTLTAEPIAAMLNLELADHPVYDGLELQWFDDDAHGTGMLAFLSRRADRSVDYYAQPGVRLDPGAYAIGGGTRSWTETEFDAARLEVADDGVLAEAVFDDVDGRCVEIRIDDRDGRPRRRGALLAPFGAAIDRPESLLLVWMRDFDLVRRTGSAPQVFIGGVPASIGRLPGARLHGRHLVKYARSVCAVRLNETGPGASSGVAGLPDAGSSDSAVGSLAARCGGQTARLVLDPSFPEVSTLTEGEVRSGRWHVGVDDSRLTGGGWWVRRRGDAVTVRLDVREKWQPGPLPALMRIVTTVAPVFRAWPTTYRWQAEVRLAADADWKGRWTRVTEDRGQSYRRWTRS